MSTSNGRRVNGHPNGEHAVTVTDQVRAQREAVYGGEAGAFYLNSIQAAADAGQVNAEFAKEMQGVHAGYCAGESSRYLPRPNGINAMGSGADYHYRTEAQYFLMMERARADDRDNMVIGQGVNRYVSNIMQDGFQLVPETGDAELNAELATRWRAWAESKTAVDYEGERTFDQMANQLLRQRTVDGDVFALPLESGQIQVMEGHRCRNPFTQRNKVNKGTGIVHGVELLNSRRVRYWFTADDLEYGAVLRKGTKMTPVPTFDEAGNRQVWHVYDSRRFTQRRGVTAFAPIVFPMKYHDDLQFAALVNSKRASVISYIHTYDFQQSIPGGRGGETQLGNRSTETREDGTTETREEGAPGSVVKAKKPGEKITPWTPNIPAPQFFQHASLLMTILSINLDLPEIVFLLDATRGNFNSYRGVIDQARQRFQQIQRDMRVDFHKEAYEWKVRQWLANDPALRRAANRAGVNIFGHRWTPQGWPYLQPVQDAAADDVRLSRNLISGRRRAQERGMLWETLAPEIVDDRALIIVLAIEKANEINKQFPEANVRWQDLAFGQEGGVRLNLTGKLDGPDDDQPEPTAPDKDNRGRNQ